MVSLLAKNIQCNRKHAWVNLEWMNSESVQSKLIDKYIK